MSQKIQRLKTGHKCLDLSNKIKKTRFTETQRVRALKEGEEGRRQKISAESFRSEKPRFITGKAITVA